MRPAYPLHGLSTCAVSDACDALGVPVARTADIRPLWTDCPPLTGRVGTLTVEPATGADGPLPALVAAMRVLGAPVLLIDLGGRVDVQCWGGVLATAAAAYGIHGALVHGAARDVEALREIGLPSYAAGTSPVRAAGRLRFAGAGGPVRLGGVQAEPGWYGVADASGVVLIPPEAAAEVGRHARTAEAAEAELLARIRTGADPAELIRPQEPTRTATDFDRQ